MYEKFLALIVVFLVGVLLASMLFPSCRKQSEYFVSCTPRVATTDPVYKKVEDSSLLTTPIGTISAFGGTQAPTGWAMCNGASVAMSGTYEKLYAVIGKSFGATGPSGQEPTHFNLPDLQGVFLRGVDGSSNRDPDKNSRVSPYYGGNIGNNVGSFQWDDLKKHAHTYRLKSGTGGSSGVAAMGGDPASHYPQTEDTLGGGSGNGNETRPRNVYVHYIIRFA